MSRELEERRDARNTHAFSPSNNTTDLVIFFPPVDVIAAFPLNAIGLRNNLASIYFRTLAGHGCCGSDSDSSSSNAKHQDKRKAKVQRHHNHVDDDLETKVRRPC